MTLNEAVKFGGRIQEGGNTIVFPHRKPPPTIIDGFIQDETDGHIFTRVWIFCVHRTLKQTCLPCPGKRFISWCKIKDVQVEQTFCGSCEIEPKDH